MNPSRPDIVTRWHVAAAIAAWLLPGLGHYLLGQRRRGLILGLSIGGLWFAGLLIGGLAVIDFEEHPAWFLGQALTAPSLIVEQVHEMLLASSPAGPQPPLHADDPTPAFEPSFGRTQEQGILYTALAGLLNLLCIIDVLYRDPRDPRYRALPPPVTEHPADA